MVDRIRAKKPSERRAKADDRPMTPAEVKVELRKLIASLRRVVSKYPNTSPIIPVIVDHMELLVESDHPSHWCDANILAKVIIPIVHRDEILYGIYMQQLMIAEMLGINYLQSTGGDK